MDRRALNTEVKDLLATGLRLSVAPAEIGDLAHALGVPVHHLAEVEHSLEQAYLTLTEDAVEHHGHGPEPVGVAGSPTDGAGSGEAR